MGGKIVWSGETEKTLERRADNDKDRQEIAEFIKFAKPGHHMSLTTGEMIVCTE